MRRKCRYGFFKIIFDIDGSFPKLVDIKIDGFNTYCRNRKNEHMGGIATAIKNQEAHNTLKVSEGSDKDEYIVTRHGQFEVPINIINVYGEIESRKT